MTEEMIPYRFPTAEELRQMERDLIRRHGTASPAGMNLDPGGSLGSRHNAQAITVGGEWYPSLSTACAVHGVELSTFLYRRTSGWTVEQALGREPPPERRNLELFEVDGRCYRGRSALAAAFGLERATLVSRLNSGWRVEQAVGLAPRPTRRRGNRACSKRIDTRALSQQCGVPESTLRHRLYRQHLSVDAAQAPGRRNGGNRLRFVHAGKHYSFRSQRRAAHYFGVRYGTVKRRLRNGATIKQALGLVPLPSRRRRRPVDGTPSRSRAKPLTFLGVRYASHSDAARAQGCAAQRDINWFIGLVRAGRPEQEIVRRLQLRLGVAQSNRRKP